jgi:hypothetical protein
MQTCARLGSQRKKENHKQVGVVPLILAMTGLYHRLNMELDLQSLLGLLYSLAGTRNPPPPRIWAHIRGRLLVS